jgi:hypothetical protein
MERLRHSLILRYKPSRMEVSVTSSHSLNIDPLTWVYRIVVCDLY